MVRFVSALAMSAAMALPSAGSPLLDAALTACGPGPASAPDRIATLAGAGWVIAADTPVRRELLALYWLMRDPFEFMNPDARTLSVFIEKRDSMTLEQLFTAGSAPDPSGIVVPSAGYSFLTVDLEAVELVAALRVALQLTSTGTADLRCTLLLAEPVPADMLDRVLPTASDPDTRIERTPLDASFMHTIEITNPDGVFARLSHTDMTNYPDFATLPAQTGSTTRLSTVIESDTRPVSLR